MHIFEPAIFILFFAILAVPVAVRFHLPLEIFLVIGSCLVSLLPNLPVIQIDPNVVFKLFLPPILFYAAYFTSWRDFKNNFRVISLLAIGLVLFSSVIVAIVTQLIFPDTTWAEGLLLGAIISPTDASAATTLIKKLNAPRRIIAILEGESLVNDAMALLLFRFSLLAVLIGSFSYSHALSQFFVVTLGGSVIGLVLASVAAYLLQHLKNVEAETTLTFLTAFTCFLGAEYFGVSGVISTVVCGIYFGLRFPQLSSSRTRLNTKASWSTVIFIINGFAFALIGLELPLIVHGLKSHTLGELVLAGSLISLVVIVARVAWVFAIAHFTRWLFPTVKKYDPAPPWQFLFLVGWCGMRGIVSLAAALSIPYQLAPGIAFPHRDFILFTTYCVIVFTLIIPTITLPALLKSFGFVDSENKVKAEAIARILALKAAMSRIEDIARTEALPTEMVSDIRKQYKRRLDIINSQIGESPFSTLNNEYLSLKKVSLATIESERQALIHLRKTGQISDEVFHRLLDELDFEELRARTLRL
jgi:CPA1 family monovalent cation:H+ antiporter